MRTISIVLCALAAIVILGQVSCSTSPKASSADGDGDLATSQVPGWSAQDMEFFLHGSMGTEFVPENVLRSFIVVYPDLFPTADLSHLGLIPDPAFGWPIGFSRGTPSHLGNVSSVGVNCAACHVAEIESPAGSAPIRILGVTSHFDAEAFFGSVIASTFRTADPANMKRFQAEYLQQSDPEPEAIKHARRRERFNELWQRQQAKITDAISADSAGAAGASADGFQMLSPADLTLSGKSLADGVDLAARSAAMLKLFHNMRTALHVPDKPPEKLPPPSGPGRNDAFGLLSAVLFAAPQPPAPVKYGMIWNVDHRLWVHWDGNTTSPIARNLLASVGLGSPLVGHQARLNFDLIDRQTLLSETIRAPRYPFAVDRAAAGRGASVYQNSCAACHEGPEDDHRLHAPAEVGTDPTRAQVFNQLQADRFNTFLSQVQTPGYAPPPQPGIRSTGQYFAPNLAGVWARSPYLHNGSVRTMLELLTPPALRATTFHRGSRTLDTSDMGYMDSGPYLFDTRAPGNSNSGHSYGTDLPPDRKRDLIEYLKTL